MGSFPLSLGGDGSGGGGGSRSHVVPKVAKVVKSKSNSSGRTYTSKFRGVHQTFPTKRWEAQFRRNGKPTSLGTRCLGVYIRNTGLRASALLCLLKY